LRFFFVRLNNLVLKFYALSQISFQGYIFSREQSSVSRRMTDPARGMGTQAKEYAPWKSFHGAYYHLNKLFSLKL